MTGVRWVEGDIDGVVVRRPARYADSRGWLAEMFRSDNLPEDELPAMGYISVTHPGLARGPHAHVGQTDIFGFFGPGTFRVRLWDNRPGSRTFGRTTAVEAGEASAAVLIVPPGVVHGYRNISSADAWVVNCPNRLYAGKGRTSPVDEVRYEDKPDSGFILD